MGCRTWALQYAIVWISGDADFAWRRLGALHGTAPELRLSERPPTDPAVLHERLTRIRAALVADPVTVIENLLEFPFRILDCCSMSYGGNDDVLRVYCKVAELLALNAEAAPELGIGRGQLSTFRARGQKWQARADADWLTMACTRRFSIAVTGSADKRSRP